MSFVEVDAMESFLNVSFKEMPIKDFYASNLSMDGTTKQDVMQALVGKHSQNKTL